MKESSSSAENDPTSLVSHPSSSQPPGNVESFAGEAGAVADGSGLNKGRLPFVRLFTDGACRGNPGPGGWAYILRHPASGTVKEASGGEPETTNNRMELRAVIEGLRALRRGSRVEVITDSEYVANGCSKWMAGWKKNDWRRREKKQWRPVKNVELWQELDRLLAAHDVRLVTVRGHSGHPENERCDELAVAAAMQFL